MNLREILKQLRPTRVEGSVDREVTGVAYDSRRITPGMIFVAIRGQNVDGHDFVPDAIDRGAAAIICERNGFSSLKAAKVVVSDSREALAVISTVIYQNPSSRMKVIGVTGTNGKTTVAFMVKDIMEAAGIKTGLIGTVRYEIGDRVIPAARTTPESLEVQQLLGQMVKAGCQVCVMEVSSHALDQKRVLGVEFDVVIFTNLTQDHLDWHGTMDNYYAAKEKLFKACMSAKKQAAVINIDDVFGGRLAQQCDLAVKLTYGLSEAAQLRATKVQLTAAGCRFQVETAGKPFDCRLPLIGRHNVYNALAATGAALMLKVDMSAIRSALSGMNPVPGRLERIAAGQSFGVYVDYAHTDDALQNVLTTLREITSGKLLLVFGCGGSRDKGKRPKMGAVAARLADYTVITSDNPRKESPEAISMQIKEGYSGIRNDAVVVELDRRRAIELAISMAVSGDTVLIAGKGHETYQEFADTVVPFDDRIYARETLENMKLRVSQSKPKI